MKRLLLVFAAILLLAGCTRPSTPNPTPSAPTGSVPATQPTTQPTTRPTTGPATLYVPESALEKYTDGAVRVYAPQSSGWFHISAFGSGVLLAGANEMQIIAGEQGVISAKTAIEGLTAGTQLCVTPTGAAYYIPASRTVIVLDPQLQMKSHQELPETIVGDPVIDLYRNEAYYIVGAEIRAMNLSTGVSRLLRQQTGVTELLPAACFDGSVLACRIQDAMEQVYTEFISAETGQTLGEDAGVLSLTTYQDRYFALRQDGRALQMLFGTKTGEVKAFSAVGDVFPLLEMNGIVTCKGTETALALSFYDLNTGKCTAQTRLPGVQELVSVCCDGTYVWLLAKENENLRLLHWDITKSAVQDDALYTGPFYTQDAPDTEAINACKALADTYAQQYGVKINIWKDATITTGGYIAIAEYQPETIRAMLEELRSILEIFPENFLLKTVEAGWIRINLVREIQGGKEWARIWRGKDCHILIAAGDHAGALFLRAVSYAVDSHVLGNSRDFDADRWTPLNPEGFTYSNEPVKPEYLTGDTRAFADEKAATSILEDRCSIFYNAIIGGNTEMFKAPIMQAKLLRLCMGIREAYGLQKSEKNYLWERYLETSLAYKK